tara:strand:+ start:1328 stop:1558 length:231 start_codon:yes stop_codon:yes gene_type:complete
MKKIILFVFWLLLFFFSIAVRAEKLAETPAPDQEEVIRYLQDEDMYQGTLSWQGSKLSSKFNYDKATKKKRFIETH